MALLVVTSHRVQRWSVEPVNVSNGDKLNEITASSVGQQKGAGKAAALYYFSSQTERKRREKNGRGEQRYKLYMAAIALS